jgi:NADH-quinone oxidoreductase subunit A
MNPYLPILISFGIALLLASIIPVLSWFFGPKKPTISKLSTYECGLEPIGNARERFGVKFYLVAMLFIVFDVEIVFLYPWAITYHKAVDAGWGWPYFLIMLEFFAVLTLGLVYAWKKGVLDWNIKKS